MLINAFEILKRVTIEEKKCDNPICGATIIGEGHMQDGYIFCDECVMVSTAIAQGIVSEKYFDWSKVLA